MSRTFPPLAPLPTASSAVAERIREAIVGGMLEPGERLKEEQLARELGTSRTPVREALLVLQSEGLVEATPNRGAAVRQYTASQLEEMYDLREVLEGHAAARAAERMTAGKLAELSESCGRFAGLVDDNDVRALVDENAFFHATILEVADSPRLTALVKDVVSLPLVYRSYVWYSTAQRIASHGFHLRLVEMFERADSVGAERLMREHVLAARAVLVAHLTAAPAPEERP